MGTGALGSSLIEQEEEEGWCVGGRREEGREAKRRGKEGSKEEEREMGCFQQGKKGWLDSFSSNVGSMFVNCVGTEGPGCEERAGRATG